TTTMVMPAANASVTATYKTAPPQTFSLTVVNGTGGGNYPLGQVVTITANTPPAGQVFDKWTGATVTDANSPSTTITMPAANTTVTALYKNAPVPTYSLTVTNGGGGG